MAADVSPEQAPLAAGLAILRAQATLPPFSRAAAAAISVNGGQTAVRRRRFAASAALRIASISESHAARPFIFQLPATSGRTSGGRPEKWIDLLASTEMLAAAGAGKRRAPKPMKSRGAGVLRRRSRSRHGRLKAPLRTRRQDDGKAKASMLETMRNAARAWSEKRS